LTQFHAFEIDLFLDICTLLCLQYALETIKAARLLSAECLLLTGTLVFRRLLPQGVQLFAMQLSLFILASAVATGSRKLMRILFSAASMVCISAAAAGFSMLLPAAQIPAAASGAFFSAFLIRRQRHILYRWNIYLQVEKDGICTPLHTLIDTGNRLRERGTSLPVLIVSARAAPALARYVQTLSTRETRILPFGVLGSAGTIKCFLPDSITVNLPGRDDHPAPRCWVGIFNGQIPGGIQALAPPEFAELQHRDMPVLQHLRQIARRFYHGLFKH